MLSEHISNATPSQIEALRQRKKFLADLVKHAVVSSGANGNNCEKSPPTPATQIHHAYVEAKPMIASPPSQPTKVRYFPGNAKSVVKIICKGCGHYFSVDYDELLSKTRTSRIATARQVAFVVTKQITGWSLPEIGRRFGGKDHTTVIHGMRKIERMRAKDAEFDNKIRRLITDVIEVIRADNPEFTVPGERERNVSQQQGEGARENTVA